jgi:hypothetical protein
MDARPPLPECLPQGIERSRSGAKRSVEREYAPEMALNFGESIADRIPSFLPR